MTKAKELRDHSIDELEASYEDSRKELFKLKNELKLSKKMEKPHLLHTKKKDIARILTVLHEKKSAKEQRAN
jgi:large subunit ribosomal protein L29